MEEAGEPLGELDNLAEAGGEAGRRTQEQLQAAVQAAHGGGGREAAAMGVQSCQQAGPQLLKLFCVLFGGSCCCRSYCCLSFGFNS